MNSKIENALSKVKSGKLDQKQLENIKKNASLIGGADEVVNACVEMLARLPKSGGAKGGNRGSGPVIEKEGYSVSAAAYDDNGELKKPELMPIVSELVINQMATGIIILKTMIKYYYKGRHMTAGSNTKGRNYYVGILDETKLMDSTIDAWEKLGDIKRGTYFSTKYVAVELVNYDDMHKALDCVKFV
jgi:hypothetical protein